MTRARGGGVRRGVILPLLAVLLAAPQSPALAQPSQLPGPESFAQDPRTPLELWGAIDYLVRTGQSAKAVPYLDRLMKSKADDETWIEIRRRYGEGSILRLADDQATARYTQPLTERFVEASRHYSTNPERIARFINGLTGRPLEQAYAVARLREAGPEAIPPLVEALRREASAPERHALLVRNMGRLDRSAVPPLLAVLESGDPGLQVDAATAIGQIGDPRAIPFLTYPAASVDSAPEVREAAQAAIRRLSGKPLPARDPSPAQALADAAWRFHRQQVEFPDETVRVWSWDQNQKRPAARPMARRAAEAFFGQRLADAALKLDPSLPDAQAVAVSLSLQNALDRVGLRNLPAGDQKAVNSALARGPAVLADVLRKATADGKDELAAAAVLILGQLTDRDALASTGRRQPLAEALAAPGVRTQLAAARALVEKAGDRPFPGASQVVPALARFLAMRRPPRAVVIDHNANRGSQLAGYLRNLGYDTTLETNGTDGFRAAAEAADMELVLLSHASPTSGWGLIDTLTNLRSDARTADIPVYVYGPLELEVKRPNLRASFPGVKYLVQPTDAATLARLLPPRPSKLPEAEWSAMAKEAASLLARIATQPKSPLAEGMEQAEPALVLALSRPETSRDAATALGSVPSADAQRTLADATLDSTRPAELRHACAEQLARSLKRFGPLVSADQETKLAGEARDQDNPQLRSAVGAVVAALRPSAAPPGRPARSSPGAEQPEAGSRTSVAPKP